MGRGGADQILFGAGAAKLGRRQLIPCLAGHEGGQLVSLEKVDIELLREQKTRIPDLRGPAEVAQELAAFIELVIAGGGAGEREVRVEPQALEGWRSWLGRLIDDAGDLPERDPELYEVLEGLEGLFDAMSDEIWLRGEAQDSA
jgi:hypothetical protein